MYQLLKYDILANCGTLLAKEIVHFFRHEMSSSMVYAMMFPNVTQLQTKTLVIYLWYKLIEIFFSCHSFIHYWGSAHASYPQYSALLHSGQLADRKVEVCASSHNEINIRLEWINGDERVSSEVRKFKLFLWSFLYGWIKSFKSIKEALMVGSLIHFCCARMRHHVCCFPFFHIVFTWRAYLFYFICRMQKRR